MEVRHRTLIRMASLSLQNEIPLTERERERERKRERERERERERMRRTEGDMRGEER